VNFSFTFIFMFKLTSNNSVWHVLKKESGLIKIDFKFEFLMNTLQSFL